MIDPHKHGTNPEWIKDQLARAQLLDGVTPSNPNREVRRQLNDMRPKRPQTTTLFLWSVFSLLLLFIALTVSALADPSPDFTAWVEARNVHPDCDTPAC